jgi:hypothetical protein
MLVACDAYSTTLKTEARFGRLWRGFNATRRKGQAGGGSGPGENGDNRCAGYTPDLSWGADRKLFQGAR